MKNVAIIGSNGMLGSDLVRYLAKTFSIAGIDKQNYSTYIGRSFDILINANGNSRRFWAERNPFKDFDASTRSVYKSIFDFKCSLYIYISSSDVYKDHSNKKSTLESQYLDTSILSPYGFHKYLSEKIMENNCSNFIILRSCMVLGTHLKKGPIYDILHKTPLYISDSSKIQMITTKEIANVIKFVIESEMSREVFNVGGRGVVNFKNIQKFFPIPITFSKETEEQKYEMNVDKLHKLFPLKTSEEYLQDHLNTIQ